MIETNSQLEGLLKQLSFEQTKLKAFFFMSRNKPRKSKKKLRKLIEQENNRLELQRKSLIENYI